MIRTLLAAAAVAVALPAFAQAQPYFEDPNGVTVYGRHGDTFSIVISVAGKPPGLVRHEIADAAIDACQALADRDPLADVDFTPNDMNSCVDDARRDGLRQYDDILAYEWGQ